MDFDREAHQRHSIRLVGYDYSGPGGYFVTVVTQGRRCLFGEVAGGEMKINALGRIVKECWEEIPDQFSNVECETYVIMPNHIHGIILINGTSVGATQASPLPNHASPLLNHASLNHASPLPNHASPLSNHASPLPDHVLPLQRRILNGPAPHSLGAIVGSFKSAVSRRAKRALKINPVWQRNYYEHILREQTDHERIAAYILANSENWDQDEVNSSSTGI